MQFPAIKSSQLPEFIAPAQAHIRCPVKQSIPASFISLVDLTETCVEVIDYQRDN